MCYRYIELNPVRANMVIHPAEYQWSSFGANALGVKNPIITPHDMWLALGDNNSTRQTVYRFLFEQDLKQHQIEEIRYGVRKGLPTGRECFKQQIEAALTVKLGSGKIGRPGNADK